MSTPVPRSTPTPPGRPFAPAPALASTGPGAVHSTWAPAKGSSGLGPEVIRGKALISIAASEIVRPP